MPLKVRKSKQRDRILQILQSERVHVTANWVYDQLRTEFPTLSLGNVYRNLNILVEQGLAVRLPFGSTFDVYEANREPHCHFVCERCGTIVDVFVPAELQAQIRAHVESTTGHIVHHQDVDLKGLCKRCAESESELHRN